jgi:uncharacterized protein YjiK
MKLWLLPSTAVALLLALGVGVVSDQPQREPPSSQADDEQPTSAPDVLDDFDPVPEKPMVGRLVIRKRKVVVPVRVNDCSGIVYHPTRKSLFYVIDEGVVGEISPDGKRLNRVAPRGARGDYEGIAVDPATGLLYVANEGAEEIIELEPDKLTVRRRWRVPRQFKGRVVLGAGGNGFEAITFVPDPKHPQGGWFLVAQQNFRLNDPDEPSAVFRIELPLKAGKDEDAGPKIVDMFEPGVIDLAGLHYDADRRRLYLLSGHTRRLYEMNVRGGVYAIHTHLPDNSVEGVTVDPDGRIYLTFDAGGAIRGQWDVLKQKDDVINLEQDEPTEK